MCRIQYGDIGQQIFFSCFRSGQCPKLAPVKEYGVYVYVCVCAHMGTIEEGQVILRFFLGKERVGEEVTALDMKNSSDALPPDFTMMLNGH